MNVTHRAILRAVFFHLFRSVLVSNSAILFSDSPELFPVPNVEFAHAKTTRLQRRCLELKIE